MGRSVDIKSTLKPLKKSEKCAIKMYATLGPAESFEMMNRAGPTRPYRSLTAYFSENIKDRDLQF